MKLCRTLRNETMCKMIKIIIGTKVVDMSASSTIEMEDTEVELDSLGIVTIDHVGPSNVSHATKKLIDMQTLHTRTELI